VGILIGRCAVLLCCLALTGCGIVASSNTTAPKASAKSTTTTVQLDDKGKPKATVTTVREALATGVGTSATGEKVNQRAETESPNVTFDGMTASGGAAKSSNKGEGSDGSAWSNPLLWAGVACILGAAAALYFGLRLAAVIALGTGLLLIAIVVYPMILLWAVAAIVVIGGVLYLRAEGNAMKFKESLRAVVAGVADAAPEVQVQVQQRVASHASEADKATIRKVRKQDGVVMASDVKAMVTP